MTHLQSKIVKDKRPIHTKRDNYNDYYISIHNNTQYNFVYYKQALLLCCLPL